jgi:hypothetical protein
MDAHKQAKSVQKMEKEARDKDKPKKEKKESPLNKYWNVGGKGRALNTVEKRMIKGGK